MATALPSAAAAPYAGASISDAVAALGQARDAWRARQNAAHREARFPSLDAIDRIVTLLSEALYPRRIGQLRGTRAEEDRFVAARITAAFAELEREVAHELGYWQAESDARFDADQPATIVRLFAAQLADIRRLVDSDIDAAFVGDPAARSTDEILLCYPGAIASLHHRIAHPLHTLGAPIVAQLIPELANARTGIEIHPGAPIVARLISELANARTGIDIHPGATIGERFFIDHGTGVVIGETAIVGDRVRLYQHVTLGARTPLGLGGDGPRTRYARHPIVGDDVVIYAGATILGRVTIGTGATIGGNVWLLSDVPAGAVVTQPEAHVLPHGAAHALLGTLAEPAA